MTTMKTTTTTMKTTPMKTVKMKMTPMKTAMMKMMAATMRGSLLPYAKESQVSPAVTATRLCLAFELFSVMAAAAAAAAAAAFHAPRGIRVGEGMSGVMEEEMGGVKGGTDAATTDPRVRPGCVCCC
jgi:hypothetical protein